MAENKTDNDKHNCAKRSWQKAENKTVNDINNIKKTTTDKKVNINTVLSNNTPVTNGTASTCW